MKTHISNIFTAAAVCLLMLSGCKTDDTDFSDIINHPSEKIPEAKEIVLDFSPLAEEAEVVPANDPDYVENSSFPYQINIAFNGDEVTLSGDVNAVSASSEGAHLLVNSGTRNVHYTLSGYTNNGSVKFYGEKKFQLTLNDVSITNPKGAAINNQCGKSLFVVLADGTTNTLTDGTTYEYVGVEDMKGTFFSEGQIIFSGTGSLNINGKCRNGIASDDYIIFRPGAKIAIITTQGHGIKANDGVKVLGSVINIEVLGNGAKGINSEAFVNIEGGRTTILSYGTSVLEAGDTTTCACIKADSTFTIARGTANLKAVGEGSKGINASQSVFVSGGEVNVVTTGAKGLGSPKALKSNADIAFSGGKSYFYAIGAKPVEAEGAINIAPGYTTLNKGSYIWEINY